MEWFKPLLLLVHFKLWHQCTRGWDLTLAYNKGLIPRSSRTIQKHKSFHYHGQHNWRSSRNRTTRFIHKKTRQPHDQGGNLWHQQAHRIHLYGGRGNRKGYYTTKNPIFRPPKSMLEMPLIWAFRPNLHNDQNPNLEGKCSRKHSPNVEWKGSTRPYRYIRHPLPQKRKETRELEQVIIKGNRTNFPNGRGSNKTKCTHQNQKRPGNGGAINLPNSSGSK